MIRIETQDLLLRDHIIEDLETHFQLMKDDQVMYYLQDIQCHSYEEAKKNLLMSIEEQDQEDRTYYFLRIEDRQGDHIGEIGYTVYDRTPAGKLVDLGYFSYAHHWGKGYMTKSVKALLDYAFMEDQVYRIRTGCLAENKGSEAVMKKCGFIKEGSLKKAQWHDGQMKDRLIYGLLKEDWLAKEGC